MKGYPISSYNQDMNFQSNVRNKSGRTIPDKMIIHILTLKELHIIQAHTMPVHHQDLNVIWNIVDTIMR